MKLTTKNPFIVLALVLMLAGCGGDDGSGDDDPGGEDATAVDTVTPDGGGEDAAPAEDTTVPDPPGANLEDGESTQTIRTAGWAAAQVIPWCRENWQADAEIFNVESRNIQPGGTGQGWFVYVSSASDPDNICEAKLKEDEEMGYGPRVVPWNFAGYEVTAGDYVEGWHVDSDLAMEIAGGEYTMYSMRLSKHIALLDGSVDLVGTLGPNHPTIWISTGIMDMDHIILDGATGEVLVNTYDQ